jgi:hypothetical protein
MTTAVQVQYRRGTASQVAAFTGAQGEMAVDTTNNRVVVQDGATAGGFAAAKLSEVVTSVLTSGGGAVTQSGGTVTIGEPGGFLNRFRNAAMDVWQRGTSSMTVTTSGAYTADGWIVTPSGASCTAVRASNNRTGSNTLYGLQLTGAASVTDITATQRIESYIAAALAGKTVTVQAQIYNNTGGSITPTLSTKYAGSADVWTSPSTDLSAANLQACANGAWTQIAYTLSVSANADAGYEFIFDFGNNFSTTGKDVVIAEIDVRVTPGVATGLNSNPPPPELRPIMAEFLLCQRYFQTSYNPGVAPGTITSTGAVSFRIDAYTTATDANLQILLVPRLRATPTFTAYSPVTGASGYIADRAAGADTAVLGTYGGGIGGIACVAAVNSGGAGLNIAGQWTASAEL